MKRTILVRPIVILSISIFIGWYFYSDDLKISGIGKDEFLKRQSLRFDQNMAHPHLSISIFGAVVVGIILFGLYELVCWIAIKTIDWVKPLKPD